MNGGRGVGSYRLVEADGADMLPAQSDCAVLGVDEEQPLGEEGDLPWRRAAEHQSSKEHRQSGGHAPHSL